MCVSNHCEADAPVLMSVQVDKATEICDKLSILDQNAESSLSMETGCTTSLDSDDESNLSTDVGQAEGEDKLTLNQGRVEENNPDVSNLANCDAVASDHSSCSLKCKRNVSFGTVLVRDYGMVLGDHPACSYGPAVQLGWEYDEYEPLDVDFYELSRDRRSHREMLLNYYMRTKLLAFAGFTEKEIKQAEKQQKKTQFLRGVTKQLSPYSKVETVIESASRKFKRLLKEDHWKREKGLYNKSKESS